MTSYDDIINLPRPVSKTRPQMPISKRAAQFAPFAALTGHDTAIKETARLTQQRITLDEYMAEAVNNQLRIILEKLEDQPRIAVTYFQPDPKKDGGSYVTVTGIAVKIDQYKRLMIMNDGTVIPIPEIISIDVV